MDLRELRYFMVLAEEQHFGRAAERLYIAQSGLSKAIQRAEAELGVALFARTRRHVELTAAGIALLARAPAVLDTFDAVQATADAARFGMVGTLSLATSPVGRYHVAPLILERFTSTCPDVRLIRREQLAGGAVEDLLAGVLDIGVIFCAPIHADLHYEPLTDVELRVLLSSSHRLAARRRIALAELRAERFLIQAEILASESTARIEPLFTAAGFVPTYERDTAGYDEDLHRVRRGDGVTLSARGFLDNPPAGIVAVGLDPPALLPLEIVRRSGEPSAILARFIELAHRTAAEQAWPLTGP